MEPIVIGTGHAGVAAAKKLVALGCRPVVLDVGRDLDDGRRALVERLATGPPGAWSTSDRAALVRNPTARDRVPRRLAFGSAHPYATDDATAPVARTRSVAPVPSTAVGGFSNVWGAAVLPTADCDMVRWPLGRAELVPAYREVLSDLPLCGADDGRSAHFPLYRDRPGHLVLDGPSEALLRRLAPHGPHPDRAVGRARLAVRPPAGTEGCTYCGCCVSGCPYGAIHTAAQDLRRLVDAGSVTYRPGHVVRTVEEDEAGVRVACDLLDGGRCTVEGARVFLAAGALNSTRIVLESRGEWDRTVLLRATDGFLVPVLHPMGPAPGPARTTLASLFVELKVPGSPHWVHVQLNPPNEVARQRFAGEEGDRSPRARAAGAALDRSLVALVNLHSEHTGHHHLTLRRRSGPPALEVASAEAPGFKALARQATRQLRRVLAPAGALPLAPSFGPPGGPFGGHVGGTLPMRRTPHGAHQTDLLGRPRPWRRVHVVDSSVFPSIPATTVALLAMANATRIVGAALAEEG